MSSAHDVAERKARLLAQSELQRLQAQLAWHDIRAVVSPPRAPQSAGSRAFSIATRLVAIALPLVGISRMRHVARYLSLGMMVMRVFRSLRG